MNNDLLRQSVTFLTIPINITSVQAANTCFMNTNLWILPQTLSPYFCAPMQYIQSVRNRNYFLSEKESCLNQKLSRAQRISVMLENDEIQVIALSLPVPSFGWQLLNNFKGTQTLGRLHYWLPLFLESTEERERGGRWSWNCLQKFPHKSCLDFE